VIYDPQTLADHGITSNTLINSRTSNRTFSEKKKKKKKEQATEMKLTPDTKRNCKPA